MNLLFEFLKELELVKRKRVNASLIESLTRREISAKPRLLQQLKDAGTVKLPPSLARSLQLQRKFASTTASSATFGILSSSSQESPLN